jgi:hypothetical protein
MLAGRPRPTRLHEASPRNRRHVPTRRACLVAAALSLAGSAALADPIAILFVGNVHDLTAAFNAVSSTGSNPWVPHPRGSVPGLFKKFTDESGLNYDVSISARNAATLRGQFLNTANAAWDLRGNVASRVWNTVVLPEQSDAALPAGKGKNANLAQFNAYADQFERFIHNGAAQTYTETQLYGSLAACQATGASATTCNTVRNIPQNTNASAATKVYLTDTWARPDMVFAHKITTPDPTTPDGRPIVDTSSAGGNATLYYGSLAAMTADLHASFSAKAASTPRFAGVIPVGDAFQLAVDLGLAKSSGFFSNGVYVENAPGDLLNLWWYDYLHASKYGSYLDALVQFGAITGLDPRSLGANEQAAADLGISSADALTLQRVASQELSIAAVPEPATWAMLAAGMMLVARGVRRRRGSS